MHKHVCKKKHAFRLPPLLAKLGVREVQQGAQLFGIKPKNPNPKRRSAEFLLNEVDDGTYLVNVLVIFVCIVKFLHQNTNRHGIIADGLGVLFSRTKRGVVLLQQRAQLGCIFGVHRASTQFMIHNLHQRAQITRIQMGVRLCLIRW